MIALDTNVIIDLEAGNPPDVERALRALEEAPPGSFIICGAVYAELFGRNAKRQDIDEMLAAAHISVDLSLSTDAWAAAGAAYGAYSIRRRTATGGQSRRILADFIIGAHACTIGTFVTSDAAFYRRVFPKLHVIDVRKYT